MLSLLVGTRKGLFVVRGQGRSWHIAAHHFAGEPVTQLLADPRDGSWYAALRMGHFGVKPVQAQAGNRVLFFAIFVCEISAA